MDSSLWPAQVREQLQLPGVASISITDVLRCLSGLRSDEEMHMAAALFLHNGPQIVLDKQLERAHPQLAALLDGLKASEQVWELHQRVNEQTKQRVNPEGLRRLLLAIVRDLRVVPILLAIELVKLRNAQSLPAQQRHALAQQASDIHAPLANRLGIWQLKWEIEDLAFRFLEPETYLQISKLLDEKRSDRERFIEQVKKRIHKALAAAHIKADVAGRPKHIFSIWKKMKRKGVPFSELYDIRAVRILVDDIPGCYTALGVIHQLWPPIPSEFDDYIAHPKGNNYRSLHTAVVGPQGKTLEVQIRTFEMHEFAELGVAAHWRYKEGGGNDAAFERKVAWMRHLLESNDDSGDLSERFSTELIEDRVYVLTPAGAVIDLPRGATVLDFAYHVHTEVGHRCRGAKVNGRIVPLDFKPNSGDQIEIMTAKESAPRRDWLIAANGFLVSGRARDKVRAWFHKLDRERNLQAGREILDKELRRVAMMQADLAPLLEKLKLSSVEDLYLTLALGDIGPSQISRYLHELQREANPVEISNAAQTAISTAKVSISKRRVAKGLVVQGVGNLLTQIARCCQPVPGDAIVGYLTKGRGVSVHRQNCAAAQRLIAQSPERQMSIEWGERGDTGYTVDVLIEAIDRKYLLKDITTLIAQEGMHISGINTRMDEHRGLAQIQMGLKVSDFGQLSRMLAKINAIAGVRDARRCS